MKRIISIYLSLTLFSCGAGVSEYSEELSGGYTFWNEGEGANYIATHSKKLKGIGWVKKYDDNGLYISVWQADSTVILKPNFKSTDIKENTYYSSDKFYIIDIKNEMLLGPYKKNKFFKKAKELNITIHWKPKVVE
jgi:hypothetical protein